MWVIFAKIRRVAFFCYNGIFRHKRRFWSEQVFVVGFTCSYWAVKNGKLVYVALVYVALVYVELSSFKTLPVSSRRWTRAIHLKI